MKRIIVLFLCCVTTLVTLAAVPEWVVSVKDYEHTETITGVLVVNDTVINTTGNVLGAFVGDEVRGVATAIKSSGKNMYFLTVYSNLSSGEKVSLRAYLQNEDSVYNLVDSIAFSSNTSLGSPDDPMNLRLNIVEPEIVDPVVEVLELLEIPNQIIPDSEVFTEVSLLDYLNYEYPSSVRWTITAKELTGVVVGDKLKVYFPTSNWVGTDTISIRAEKINDNTVFDVKKVVYSNVAEPDVVDPVVELLEILDIPDQIIPDSASFTEIYLLDYLNYASADSVKWTVTGSELTAVIQNHKLKIYFPESDWVGTDTLVIRGEKVNDNTVFDIEKVTFTIVTGFEGDVVLRNDVSVYPNPATDILYLPEGEFSLHSLTGDLISSGYSKGSVDVSGILAGVYIVNIKNKYHRIVIE